MMRANPFDRHEFIKTAVQTGMPEAQAEVIASYVQEVHKAEDNRLATKQDVQEVERKLEHKIEVAKAELEHKIESSKVDLLKWYVGIALFQTTTMVGAIVALVKLLH